MGASPEGLKEGVVMKKINKGNGKLALHRETLGSLTPSELDGVVGGAAAGAIPPTVSQVASHLAPSWLRTFCHLCR
jgi:hypothetical protein